MASFTERMLGASRLDEATYEEVEADTGATGQALGVVVLTGLAAGIGLGAGLSGLVVGTLATVLGWYVWAFITYFVGTRWFPEPQTHADWGQVLRTVGFANAPAVLRVLGIIPGLRTIVFAVTGIWVLVAVVVAASAPALAASIRAVAAAVRPEWAPPSSWFGPVWTVLYALMSAAAWLVWRADGFREARGALTLFLLQLAPNALWSWLFFGWHRGALAFADILLLWVLIIVTLIAFWRVRALAGALLIPYLLWVSFASALNYAVWQLNPQSLG